MQALLGHTPRAEPAGPPPTTVPPQPHGGEGAWAKGEQEGQRRAGRLRTQRGTRFDARPSGALQNLDAGLLLSLAMEDHPGMPPSCGLEEGPKVQVMGKKRKGVEVGTSGAAQKLQEVCSQGSGVHLRTQIHPANKRSHSLGVVPSRKTSRKAQHWWAEGRQCCVAKQSQAGPTPAIS